MSQSAPIVLFAYKRPEHTRRTVEALKANPGADRSELYLFSDGPKNEADREAVDEVRSYLRTVTGFARVQLEESPVNRGLAESVIHGVSEIVSRFGRAIVLEDDMVTSPVFLDFMNQALNRFESDERIAAVHGYTIPLPPGTPDYFLRPGADCWGWAVWERSWKLFRSDAGELYRELRGRRLTREFDGPGRFPYCKMLRDQARGKVDSWAIRWRASVFLANAFTLQSGRPLLDNIGGDRSGTHCREVDSGFPLWNTPIPVDREPLPEPPEAAAVYQAWQAALRVPFGQRIRGKIAYEWNRLKKNLSTRHKER